MKIFITRRPVFRADQSLFAYELLYRDNYKYLIKNQTGHKSGFQVKNHVTYTYKELASDKKVLIAFESWMSKYDFLNHLDKKHVVIELLEKHVVDEELMLMVKRLKFQGFQLALDQGILSSHLNELVEMADIIKFDYACDPTSDLEIMMTKFKGEKILLAKNISTFEEYQAAKDLGFDLFHGMYYLKNKEDVNKRIEENFILFIRLMSEFNKREPCNKYIIKLISQDASLSFKILKLLNNAYQGHHEGIQSIQEAVRVLGLGQLKKWIVLAMIQNATSFNNVEVAKLAVARSIFLKNIYMIHHDVYEEIELLGLLTILDVLLEIDRQIILESLTVSDLIKATLAGCMTIYQPYLDVCYKLEKGQIKEGTYLGINKEIILNIYMNAIKKTDQLFDYISNSY